LRQFRKNLVKGTENTQNIRQHPVTRLAKGTEDKENDEKCSFGGIF